MRQERYDFVVFSDDWGRHPSSCQHLFAQLAKRHRVLWVNTIGMRAVRADGFTVIRGLNKLSQWARPLRQISENFWVYSPWMLPIAGGWMGKMNSRAVSVSLKKVLARCGIPHPILFTSVPTAADYVGRLDERALVYYITDDYRRWPGADAEMVAAQDRLLCERADLVLPCTQALAEGRQFRGRAELLPHAVDLEHFARGGGLHDSEPDDLAAIPHPRLGFFGLIYEKVDLSLFARIARLRPQWQLVLIGPVRADTAALAGLSNVHLLGAKSYKELPRYLHGLDALLLAYVLDEQTLRNAPLKIRECLAVGKPIIAKAIPDLEQYSKLIHLAKSEEEYLTCCQRALAGIKADAAAMRQAVAGQTWEARAEQVETLLGKMFRESARISDCGFRIADLTSTDAVQIANRESSLRSRSGCFGGVGSQIENAEGNDWDEYVVRHPMGAVWHRFAWTKIMRDCYAMRTRNLCLRREGKVVGILPVVLQKSRLFGRHLVSLPWLDYAGILADDEDAQQDLLEQAKALAVELKADLTLRQLVPLDNFGQAVRGDKVVMQLELPGAADELWRSFSSKVRNQVRKAEKSGLMGQWCGAEALDEFFHVYSTNMRDLGSPPHSRRFFASVLAEFHDLARLMIVRHAGAAVAAALVLADPRCWQVPWASSLRAMNHLCPNHMLYWSILKDACGDRALNSRTGAFIKGAASRELSALSPKFSFGRSSRDSGTFNFKEQWGARPVELAWQSWPGDAEQSSGQVQEGLLVRAAQSAWRRLPVPLARLLGPQLIKTVG